MDDTSQEPSSPADAVRDLLEVLVESFGLEASVRVTLEEDTLTGTLESEDPGLFIGRHGHTIDAVEHLARRIALRGAHDGPRVVIDAAGYRERRQAALEAQADSAADEAVRFGRPVSLDAMGAAERRLVHEFLRDREDVETHSEGDEPDRHLVVTPRED